MSRGDKRRLQIELSEQGARKLQELVDVLDVPTEAAAVRAAIKALAVLVEYRDRTVLSGSICIQIVNPTTGETERITIL